MSITAQPVLPDVLDGEFLTVFVLLVRLISSDGAIRVWFVNVARVFFIPFRIREENLFSSTAASQMEYSLSNSIKPRPTNASQS